MPTGMGAANPKLSKGGRKLKRAKHCTISINLEVKSKMKNLQFEELYLNYEVFKRITTMENLQNEAPNQV